MLVQPLPPVQTVWYAMVVDAAAWTGNSMLLSFPAVPLTANVITVEV